MRPAWPAFGGRASAVVNLTLALAGTAVALGVLEIALRVLGIERASYHAIGGFTVYDPELGWRLAPSRETVFKGAHFTVRVSHNADGLRDRPYPREREPGRRRVLVLGDSFVWCWGVEQERCFTERLEAALGDTDVINAGVPGYSTAQELLFYEREGRRYRPDLVLLVFVPNDVVENLRGLGPRFRLEDGQLVATNVPVPRRKDALGEWLNAHSRVFAELNYMAAMLRESSHELRHSPVHAAAGPAPREEQPTAPALAPAGKGERLTEALLDRLAADVKGDGARFAAVLEAMPPPMARWLHGFFAARGIPCLELGPALRMAEVRGERVRLIGDPHVATAGQAVVTSELLAFLERERLLPDSR